DGEPWRATWEQALGEALAGRASPREDALQVMAFAIRVIRLGQFQLGLKKLADALANPALEPANCRIAKLHQVQLLRLVDDGHGKGPCSASTWAALQDPEPTQHLL